jgi:hypothetical protein
MDKDKYNQIIDEVYENYSKEYEKDNSIGLCLLAARMDGRAAYRKPDKEMFVGLCTYDKTFSEKWGLNIEERELSTQERNEWFQIHLNGNNPFMKSDWKDFELDQQNIPTKLITLTYNNETITSYE